MTAPHGTDLRAAITAVVEGGYVQHLAGCPVRNDGRRWEPHYKRGRWRPTGWYGAWIPEPSAKYDCTCGLADHLARLGEGK